jgi:copper chaperone CopZ
MTKVNVRVDGMMCGMCEAHMCDAIRKAVPEASKVSASRKTGYVSFVTEGTVDEETLQKAVTDTGYTFGGVTTEPYHRKKFLGLF